MNSIKRTNILFVYGHFFSGGSETLILRMSRYLRKRNYEVTLSCIDIIDEMQDKFQELNIKVFTQRKIEREINILRELNLVITFGDYDFLVFEEIRRKYQLNYITLLYVVHPYTLTEWSWRKNLKILKRIVDKSYGSIIEKYILNGNIFFLDDECKKNTLLELGIDRGGDDDIFPIPFEFDVYDEKVVENKAHSKNGDFNILTIARADFPFKGYLKGLIESISQLACVYNNIFLTIVSYGDEIEKVREWISQNECNKICLIEGMDYDSLKEMYMNAHLYVGMGTTLIESVNGKTIAIPVESYTYECNTWGFLDEKVEWLLTAHNTGMPIGSYIESVILESETEYCAHIRRTWEVVFDYYEDDKIIERILKKQILHNGNWFGKKYGFIVTMKNKIKWFLKKLKR